MSAQSDIKEAQHMNLIIKGVLSDMPDELRHQVYAAADELRTAIAKHGDMGTIALSLVATEQAMKP